MGKEHDIKVTIEAEAQDVQSGFSKATNAIKSFASSMKGAGSTIAAEADRIDSKLGNFGTPLKLAVAGAAGALGALGLASVKAAGQMAQTEKGFATMLGSASSAKGLLKELSDFASSTPFDLPGVLDGSKRLLAMGFNAEQVVPTLTAVGDASAALGLGTEGINRLTLAIGQMAAKGKVSGEEMRQLAEAGVPAWDMLAKKIGVSIPEAMKMSEQGAINAATGVQAILSSMNDKYGGLMKEQSGEILGIWANMQDEIGRLAVTTGDEITEAFDLKTKMKGALDFLEEFRGKVESSGLKNAIMDQMPSEAFAAGAAVVASALYLTVIPSLVAATKAAQAYWLALAGGTASKMGLAGIAITGVAALAAYKYSEYEKDPDAASRNVFANEGLDYDEYKTDTNTAPKQGMGDFRAAESAIKPKADINNMGFEFGKGIGTAAKGAKGAADKINREIDRINESLSSLKDKALDAQTGFDKMRLDNAFSDLEGGAAVIGNLWKPAIDEVIRMQDEIKRLSKIQEDAQTLLARAQIAGNAEQIAKAQEQANKIAQLKVEAETYASNRQKELWEKNAAEEAALHTQVAATKAEIDKAYREGDMVAYLAALEEKKLAEMVDLQEKQAMMQAYFDWEMESRTTMQSFMLEAMETFKTGMGSAFADAIVNGENLGKAFQNIGKQIVSMFIQWKVQQGIAAAYSSMLKKKQTAETAAEGASQAVALKPAAVYQATITHGAAAVQGAAALSAAMSIPIVPNATGGITTGPTLSLIGEGRYKEAVLPLGGPNFKRFFAPLLGDGENGQQVSATQNIYGDINNGSDEESLFENFTSNLAGALRGA